MIEKLYDAFLRSRCVTTDSRRVIPGCLFFALKGEHFDGNAFVPQALDQGAALCITSDGRFTGDSRCVTVEDVLATLQALAAHHRRQLQIPFIGITGTNGKTTTKELITAVLARRYRVSATKGNFNNHLGVPLTLLAIPADAEIAVVEMGANHPGEIEFLCRIADPDSGLITNVGRAHLEGFGGLEGVVHTKTELYRHLAGKQGLVFVNADDPRLMHEAERLATIPGLRSIIPAFQPDNPAILPSTIEKTPLAMSTYGRSQEADIRGTLVTHHSPYLHFYFEVGDNLYNVHTRLLGDYNMDNCMAAVAVGLHYGVDPFDIKEAIEQYAPSNKRSQFVHTERNALYLDCYNANPSSMSAAIDSFRRLDAGNKMAIIGGMHELGRDERKEHQRLVEQLRDCRLERVYLVGSEFDGLELSAEMILFSDTEHLSLHIQEHPIADATILIKGSNTNRLWALETLL